MSSTSGNTRGERGTIGSLATANDPNVSLSRDLEYPPCPSCDENEGLFTQVCENSDQMRCLACGTKFGDIKSVVTTRDLPNPIKDDFVACVVGGEKPEQQASHRDVQTQEVYDNLKRAEELLSFNWVRWWRSNRAEEE